MSQIKEVVKIRVKKCDGNSKAEYKKMSVDPQLTSYDILRSLLIRAFDIKRDFSISYLGTDDSGSDTYLSLLSDWDLDAAIDTSSCPYLCLKVDLRPFEPDFSDWEVIGNSNHSSNLVPHNKTSTNNNNKTTTQTNNDSNYTILTRNTNAINSFFGKTVSNISKAIGLKSSDEKSTPRPEGLSDTEFKSFQNAVGSFEKHSQFRLAVYNSGIEPVLRKVAWRHILNAYPHNLNGRQRYAYLKEKEKEYYELRDRWKDRVKKQKMSECEIHILNTVRKDVLRTDRQHHFYSGADDNNNTLSLYHLLVTYALNHPSVSYCQGMSDMASPLLLVQEDESHTYLCFCALMQRLKGNFSQDGLCMTRKFQHLSLLLAHHDIQLAKHLKKHCLEADLFFCYRWILLEMKREFPLNDALYVLEVMWSTLPLSPPPNSTGVPFVEAPFSTPPITTFTKPSTNYINLRKRLNSLDQGPTTPNLSSSLMNNHLTTSPLAIDNKDNPSSIESQIFLHDHHPMPHNISQSYNDQVIKEPISKTTEVNMKDNLNLIDLQKVLTRKENSNMQSNILVSKYADSSNQLRSPCDETMAGLEGVAVSEVEEYVEVGRQALDLEIDFVKDQQNIHNVSNKKIKSNYVDEKIEKKFIQNDFSDNTTKCDKDDIVYKIDKMCQKEGTLSNSRLESVDDEDNYSESEQISLLKNNAKKPVLDHHTKAPKGEEEEDDDILNVPLPGPEEFGEGNPFLMFLCLSLLLEYRDHILQNKLDYNEVAMFYDRLVRKQDAYKVVKNAKDLYKKYLKNHALMSSNTANRSEGGNVMGNNSEFKSSTQIKQEAS